MGHVSDATSFPRQEPKLERAWRCGDRNNRAASARGGNCTTPEPSSASLTQGGLFSLPPAFSRNGTLLCLSSSNPALSLSMSPCLLSGTTLPRHDSASVCPAADSGDVSNADSLLIASVSGVAVVAVLKWLFSLPFKLLSCCRGPAPSLPPRYESPSSSIMGSISVAQSVGSAGGEEPISGALGDEGDGSGKPSPAAATILRPRAAAAGLGIGMALAGRFARAVADCCWFFVELRGRPLWPGRRPVAVVVVVVAVVPRPGMLDAAGDTD